MLEALAELVQLGRERCQATGMPTGVEPWSELIAERNVLAHYAPDDITPTRLWFDTVSDIGDLELQVEQAIGPSD